MVEQVVNPTNFEGKIADEVSFFLGLEQSDLNELIADKLDDISDEEDDLLQDELIPEEEARDKIIGKSIDLDVEHSHSQSIDFGGSKNADIKMEHSKTNEESHDEGNESEAITKECKSKISEEEFSRKFRNTFAEATPVPTFVSETLHLEETSKVLVEADMKTDDISQSGEITYSNSSISDGSLTCAQSPEPVESTKSELDLSSKIEDEIANQLEQDIACVQHIYKDLVNDSTSVNANAAPSFKSSTSNASTPKVTFTASQLTFKDKFLFVNEKRKESMETKDNAGELTSQIETDTNDFEEINEPLHIEINMEDVPESMKSFPREDAKEETKESVRDKTRENIEMIKETRKNDNIDPQELIKEDVNETMKEIDHELSLTVKVKNESPSEESKCVKDTASTNEPVKMELESNINRLSRTPNLSEFHRNQRIAKEKSDKLAKIQDELREKRDFVRYRLKDESYVKKTASKDESLSRKISKSSVDKAKASKLSKTTGTKHESKLTESSKGSSSGKKNKLLHCGESSSKKKTSSPNRDSNEFASDVSSVHTSDLSDFDDQISLSSSEDEEHRKKKISMQQLKQMLH